MRPTSDEDDVITAARERAAALVRGDAVALDHILHPDFGWISHEGQHFDRTSYIDANRQPGKRWYDQELRDPHVPWSIGPRYCDAPPGTRWTWVAVGLKRSRCR